MSNAEAFPHNHDEIDIELLGHDKRNNWVMQTNLYANGSVSTGREEKFYLWFDPTEEHHYYSIVWNAHHIVFLVDNIPVREFIRKGNFYPSKPMTVYTTIWDGSEWATHGGKYPVSYVYAPYVASISQVQLVGCISPASPNSSNPGGDQSSCSKKTAVPSSLDPVDGQYFAALSSQQVTAMQWARSKLLFYSYCKDIHRFKVLPPECN